MTLEEYQLNANSWLGGGVRRIVLQDSNIKITQITTFCPDLIGPGPTQLYLIESDALILLDTGLPTDLAKDLFYRWRNGPIPREIDELPPNYSEQQFLNGLKAAGYNCTGYRSDRNLTRTSRSLPARQLHSESMQCFGIGSYPGHSGNVQPMGIIEYVVFSPTANGRHRYAEAMVGAARSKRAINQNF